MGMGISEIQIANRVEDRGSWSGGKYRLTNWTHNKIHLQVFFTVSNYNLLKAIYFETPKYICNE